MNNVIVWFISTVISFLAHVYFIDSDNMFKQFFAVFCLVVCSICIVSLLTAIYDLMH